MHIYIILLITLDITVYLIYLYYIHKCTLKKRFNTTRECQKLLYNYNHRFECKCGNKSYFEVSNFGRVCKICKKKYSVTNGTIFHNVRFGLLKAFRIVLKEYNNSFTSSSSKIALDFKITQKTAWIFIDKVRKDKENVINLIEFKKDSKKVTKEIPDVFIKKLKMVMEEVEKLRINPNEPF